MSDDKILFIFFFGMAIGIFKDKEDFERLKIVFKLPDVVEFNKWLELRCSYPIRESILDSAIDNIQNIYVQGIDGNKNITEEIKGMLKVAFAKNCIIAKLQIKQQFKENIVK